MKQAYSRQMRLTAMLAMLAFSLAVILPVDGSAQANNKSQTLTTLVQGTVAGGGAFNGVLNITGFTVQNGVLNAVGNLTGTLLNAAGGVVGNISNQLVTIPVASVSGSCQILSLTLGPLDLNLLGLMVHLNQVVLNITAQSGNGNLLGNLLCSVANLLNGGSPLSGILTQLSGLLNQLLQAL